MIADIWFRCFGVGRQRVPGGALAEPRDERGYLRVDEHLRVVGETGSSRSATSPTPTATWRASRRPGRLVAANIRALITGEGELAAYQPFPPLSRPAGPRGRGRPASRHDGVAGPGDRR